MRTKTSITGNSNRKPAVKVALHHAEAYRKRGGELGFTLMELIVVCSIVGLLLSIAIPSLRNSLITNQLDTVARQFMGTVKELRQKAVRSHRAYVLHFDLDEQTYWYEEEGKKYPLGEKPENIFRLPEGVSIDDVQTHGQGTANGGDVSLWISRKGYMDQTVVHLSDEDGKVFSIFFSPFSGSAKIYDEYMEIE